MEVVLVALAGLVIIGVVWELTRPKDHDHVARHERLMRELHRHD